MTIRTIAFGLAFAGAMAAQTFIHMADPQFGMYTRDQSFEHETANFEFAIATANRLKPAFVVVAGDLINEPGNAAQAAEYQRVAARLDPKIRLFNVPGNHDVGNEPTSQSLAAWRKRIGPDYYTFRVGEMEQWLPIELAKARREGVKHLIVFQHIPFFLSDSNEEDQYFNIPRETRLRYLGILHAYGVRQVFAGHYHRNAWGLDGDLEMVTSGPVGMPLGGGKSGIRVVAVADSGVIHTYYDFGEMP
jgi:predicted phosphodiesterase